ncbi:prenyl cysteine carboxyl methyltransferase ste14 [Xylariales sp. PMI_506]|nr:prenyl cysteine carboxyl methyltransferase ste14 [Xylariales sp. PMI_506]
MALPISFAQASLAAAILASAVGTYIGVTPPNPAPATAPPSAGDWVRRLNLTHKHTTKACFIPLGFLTLHVSALALRYPGTIPASVLRHGAVNPLNPDLITWSPATVIPLALILGVGAPLRLVPYTSLGRNFTFELAEPDRLVTTGIYRYVQHPSYTGLVLLIACNFALLCRADGAMSCWVPPRYYTAFVNLEYLLVPMACLITGVLMWTRVKQEESMLRAKFGRKWDTWHAATARFIPWVF